MGGNVGVDELRRLYVDEQLSTTQIGPRVGMPPSEVWRALHRAGVEMRQRGPQPRLAAKDLRRWYQHQGLSTVEIARRTGMSTSGVTAALERAGIARRPLTKSELPIEDHTLERLYVTERLEREDIAARYGVPPWAVTRRLREAGVRRPYGQPPGGGAPPREELEELYVDKQLTLSELAASYGVPDPTARRWLKNYGIQLRARPRSAGVRPETRPQLTRDQLWELYVDQGLTTHQIAAQLGVTKNIVLTALHAQRIPVRGSGASRQPPVILLDALYADPAVTAALQRHNIDRRPQAGWLRERWPVPVALSDDALYELYVTVGLSTNHISLLTGHQPAAIRHRLQQAGLSARDTARSPWKTTTPQHP